MKTNIVQIKGETFIKIREKSSFWDVFSHLPFVKVAVGQVPASLCTNLPGGHILDLLDHFQDWDLVWLETLWKGI